MRWKTRKNSIDRQGSASHRQGSLEFDEALLLLPHYDLYVKPSYRTVRTSNDRALDDDVVASNSYLAQPLSHRRDRSTKTSLLMHDPMLG